MLAGVSGSLLSHEALERIIPESLRGRLGEADRERASRRLRAWHRSIEARLGPSASARMVFDQIAGPLVAQLGYKALPLAASGLCYTAILEAGRVTPAVLLVTAWGQDLTTIWREAVRRGIGCDARWCLCVSGPAVRLTDSQRTYSRRFLEFDLHAVAENDATFSAMWGLLRASALVLSSTDGQPALDRAIAISEQHLVSVRGSLQHGVQEALVTLTRAFVSARGRRRVLQNLQKPDGITSADESLIVIYRILFLLFAEARGLVPQLASRLPRELHDRIDPERCRNPAETSRPVGNTSGHLAPRSSGMPCGIPSSAAVQRSPLLACARATLRRPGPGRWRRAAGCARVDDAPGTPKSGRSRADRLRGSRRRAARRRVRAVARLQAARRLDDGAGKTGQAQGHRILLHAAFADRIPRSPHARPTRSGRHTRADHRACGSSIPRWAAARSSWPPVATSPRRTKRRWFARVPRRARTSRRRTGQDSGGRSHSDVCTASTSTRWPFNWAACRSGSRRSLPAGP